MSVSTVLSPFGMLEIEISDQSLLSIKKSNKKVEHISNDALSKSVTSQMKEYMDGRRTSFDLPLKPQGTVFQQAVWKALLKIPRGQTRTYGQLAAMIDKPAAARAVGNALNKNPLCIVVPCHRVLPSSGKLGGFAYGTAMKKKLLELEGAI